MPYHNWLAELLKCSKICPFLCLGLLSWPQKRKLAPYCFLEGLQGHSGTSNQNMFLQRTISIGFQERFPFSVFAVSGY